MDADINQRPHYPNLIRDKFDQTYESDKKQLNSGRQVFFLSAFICVHLRFQNFL